jgi:predicted transcriptional regulator
VRELFDELRQERAIAYTTVMSTMDNLHRKGWLDRVKEGKAYRYAATASREEYSARLMSEALADGGNAEAVLTHFVAEMDGGDSELLRAVIRRLGQAVGGGAAGGGAVSGGAVSGGAVSGGAVGGGPS